MVVVSTPKGLLNKQQAVKQGVGGELLFRVW
jgi:ribosomal protein S8